MIKVALHHMTRYRYDRPVNLGPHIIRLRPASHSRTEIDSYSFKVEPRNHFLNWQQDSYGNYLARLVFPERTWELKVTVDLVANIRVINPFDFFLEPHFENYPVTYTDKSIPDSYFNITEESQQLDQLAAEIREQFKDSTRTIDFLVAVNQKLYDSIRYVIRMEPGIQSCEQTLSLASGSCRDSSVVLSQLLRRLGFATRFVSGYLIQLKPDVVPKDGPPGPEKDFTDLHAWTEVYLEGAGWVGLDPTSGLLTGEGHIPLAATPEPVHAAAIDGLSDTAQVDFHFEMNLDRIYESPRVTGPYHPETWKSIEKLSNHIQKKIAKQDLRLTIGGEPTFVSKDNFDAPEWNHSALGKDKLKKAQDLMQLLKRHYATGGILQNTQGKWYPGEVLPRWAMNCYFRTDNESVDNSGRFEPPDEYSIELNDSDMNNLSREICKQFGIDESFSIDAFEDPFYHIWKEGTLPEDFALKKEDPFEELERNRIRNLFDRGLEKRTAIVIPLAPAPAVQNKSDIETGRWQSSIWKFKRDKLFLLPGDSPAGLRLPITAIADKFRESPVADITEKRKLPDYNSLISEIKEFYTVSDDRDKLPLITALVIEKRKHLTVFLPPFELAQHFLEALARIEIALKNCNLYAELTGYTAPNHPDLVRFSITPDPGVIEVNLHPSETMAEMIEKTRTLYECAEEVGLTTQKFMIDGRPQATGGGNHITVGAKSPLESPFLRRPTLLRSLVTYFQHHPSLSYLFSGLFIGPTSQAPRVDEGRDEVLYELETAFEQLDRFKKEPAPPWLVDRLLRNHLVDLTGNTHRAEFSIDKLYSPEGFTGRLGLVEMRGFEMQPHWKMNVVTQMLVSAIIARLDEHPYRKKLVRWGTRLHDKFMLPEYIKRDFNDVLDDLNHHGFDFRTEHFDPFFEFRFPVYGILERDSSPIRLELRMALEPWNVLGEETIMGSTSRSVDSAVERLQVLVDGFTEERFRITCNGYILPLQQTMKKGQYVAGVRFKAWNPPSTLHPNIPVHSPLIFDIYDTWSDRVISGCTYHVSHPGGRSYETLPVNAFEAESRRISRFEARGHTPGQFLAKEVLTDEYPCTLDLRKAK